MSKIILAIAVVAIAAIAFFVNEFGNYADDICQHLNEKDGDDL